MADDSCSNCVKYKKKDKKCPIMFGIKQAWEWCTAHVRKG